MANMEAPRYTFIVSLFIIFFLLSSWLRAYIRKDRTLRAGIGPRPWPICGNLPQFLRLFRDPDKELKLLAKKYGGITKLWLGSQPVLVISKAKDAKDLLDFKGSIYSDRPSQDGFRQRVWPFRIAAVGVGPEFRRLRAINHKLLSSDKSFHFRGYQDYESIVMLQDLLDAPKDFSKHSERFSISVLFSAIFGVRLVQLDHPTITAFFEVWAEILHNFQPGTLLVDYFPILSHLPERLQPWLRRAYDLQKRELELYGAFLAVLRAQIRAGTAPVCFAAEFLKLKENEACNDDEAIGIFGMIIGAGADATTSMVQNFFKIMAMNPRAFRAAQEEIDRVVGRSRLPSWEDQSSLPYLRALIKEVHRWAPIGTLGIPHAASQEDLDLGVPKGTIVFPNIPALNRDPEVYENPDSFYPERFLGDELDASASANQPDFRRRDHCHYGFGRRVCQGIFVAEASLYIIFARIIWAFDISTELGAPPLELNDKTSGLITKPRPYSVRIDARSDQVKECIQAAISRANPGILDFDSVKVSGHLTP
ncbi:cytochrome P450 [Xylaria telfairii]|nr:cytochrome P450 [Xylaria telfairii]